MSESEISINVLGTQKAINGLMERAGGVRRGARIAMDKTTLRMRGRVKEILDTGRGGAPKSRSRHLSQSIVNLVIDEGGAIVGQVGSTMPYKTGYAAILEKGGALPAVTIVAKPGKVLAWPVGFGKMAFRAHLAGGGTMKGARTAAIRASTRSGGKYSGYIIVRKVHLPARYQRAMPYLGPGFEEERPLIPETFQIEIARALNSPKSGNTL